MLEWPAPTTSRDLANISHRPLNLPLEEMEEDRKERANHHARLCDHASSPETSELGRIKTNGLGLSRCERHDDPLA